MRRAIRSDWPTYKALWTRAYPEPNIEVEWEPADVALLLEKNGIPLPHGAALRIQKDPNTGRFDIEVWFERETPEIAEFVRAVARLVAVPAT
jgi:hypothetical protein